MTLLMVTFFMSVSMISCDDDDEKNGGQTAKEMLVGQWVLIKDMTDINGETDTEEYPAEAREEILTFKADGSCSKLVIYYEEEFEDMGDMIHLKSEMTYARL